VIARNDNGEFHWLEIYPAKGYQASIDELFDAVGGYDPSDEGHVYVREEMFLRKEKIAVDQAGRILIKESLREFAALDKKVLILGVGDHVAIWDPDARAEFDKQQKAKHNRFNLTRRTS
jgi:MraZ protein